VKPFNFVLSAHVDHLGYPLGVADHHLHATVVGAFNRDVETTSSSCGQSETRTRAVSRTL
jgi:hypothetical protein